MYVLCSKVALSYIGRCGGGGERGGGAGAPYFEQYSALRCASVELACCFLKDYHHCQLIKVV